jgi:hypothetical protein
MAVLALSTEKNDSSVRVLRDFHAEAGKEPAGGGKRAADFHLDPVDAGAVAIVGHID